MRSAVKSSLSFVAELIRIVAVSIGSVALAAFSVAPAIAAVTLAVYVSPWFLFISVLEPFSLFFFVGVLLMESDEGIGFLGIGDVFATAFYAFIDYGFQVGAFAASVSLAIAFSPWYAALAILPFAFWGIEYFVRS